MRLQDDFHEDIRAQLTADGAESLQRRARERKHAAAVLPKGLNPAKSRRSQPCSIGGAVEFC